MFLLVGPSGTGKTETALALADALFGGESADHHQSLRVPGAAHRQPAEGFSAGLRRLRPGRDPDRGGAQTPYSVVLLDEVEKAHRDVMNLFYQVFDRG
ncbi:AAA family ATPase [Klebsiella variicola subsp. variicola]|nr:AAA family ATPase [Klebsiella variicola subsp. variicola]